MWKMVSGIGIIGFLLWVWLYLNELASVPRPMWGEICYIGLLLYPSIAFWILLWIRARWVAKDLPAPMVVLFSFSVAASLLVASVLVGRVPRLDAKPALFSLSVAAYVYSLVLGLAAVFWWQSAKQYILHNRLLGKVAFGLALAFWLSNLILSVGMSRLTRNIESLGRATSVCIEVLFLLALLVAFLSLLNEGPLQNLLGVAAFAGLSAFLVYSRTYIFSPLLMIGTFFWPLVLFISLNVESILLRVLGSLGSRVIRAVGQ